MFDLAEIYENFAFDTGVAKLVIDEICELGEFTVGRMAELNYTCGESSRRLAEAGYRSEGFKELHEAVFQLTGKMAMTMLGKTAQGMINHGERNIR
jgi:hypothetical protein